MKLCALVLLLVSSYRLHCGQCFVSQERFFRRGVVVPGSKGGPLFGVVLILEDDDDDDNDENVNARKQDAKEIMEQFSSLLQSDGESKHSPEIQFVIKGGEKEDLKDVMETLFSENTIDHKPVPIAEWKEELLGSHPLTTGARLLLEKEIALLEQLKDGGDGALTELQFLWRNARGSKAARLLSAAEALNHPLGGKQAEEILVKVIREEGIRFVEPLFQLAIVKLRQGKIKESKELSETVLSQKPWHVGALSSVHQACRALNDYEGLARWDREQLPPSTETRQRTEWVHRMVQKAKVAMEEKGLESLFEDQDGGTFFETDQGNAWQ